MLKKSELNEIYNYINIYNDNKSTGKGVKFYLQNDTDVKVGVKETDTEVIVSFYNSKNSFKFISDYSKFRKKYNNLEIPEKEKSRFAYEEFINTMYKDKTLEFFRDKKLNNPFRSYEFNPDLFKLDNGISYYNFFINQEKYYMHSGFIKLFNSISYFYYNLINNYINNTNKQIVIIGFSFASVVARIAYLCTYLTHPFQMNRVKCFLYSTPNIGNSHFEKMYSKLHIKEKNRHLYIINCNDDCMYNLLSKRYGFYHIKSTLLIKMGAENSKIYDSIKYCRILKSLIC